MKRLVCITQSLVIRRVSRAGQCVQLPPEGVPSRLTNTPWEWDKHLNSTLHMWSPSQAGRELPDFGGSNSASETSWSRGQCPHQTSSGTESPPLPGPLLLPTSKGTSAHTHTLDLLQHTHTLIHIHGCGNYSHSPDLRLLAFLPGTVSYSWVRQMSKREPSLKAHPAPKAGHITHRGGTHTSTSPGSPSSEASRLITTYSQSLAL